MGNICKPECMNGEDTQIKIKSSCFDKPIIIHMSNDDEDTFNHLQDILNKIQERKNSVKKEVIKTE